MRVRSVVLGAATTLAGAVALSGPLATLPARAAALVAPLTTGSSPYPILGVANTGTGEAIDATAAKNYGIVGRTNFATSTAATHYGGIGGVDASAGTARSYNTGVFGTSQNGVGVLGQTSFNGWNTTTIFPTSGVVGADNSTKTINGYSLQSGVYGTSTYGNGVEGVGKSGTGVFGQTNSTSTTVGFASVYGFDGNSAATSQNVGVFGYSKASAGMYGASGSGFGVYAFSSTGDAAYAAANRTGTALRLVSFGTGPLATASNGTTDVMSLDHSGNLIVKGTVTQSGSPLIARPTTAGTTVLTRAVETTSATLEDTGEARLTNGRATVDIPSDFARTIDGRAPYLVFVTPEGLTAGMLCVVARGPRAFVVSESNGGRSTVAFAFRIVARPLADSATRLPLASRTIDAPRERARPAIALREDRLP